MDGDVAVLKRMYDRFNARDIDGVLAALADDVVWANGMDGGQVTAARPFGNTGPVSGLSSVRASSP